MQGITSDKKEDLVDFGDTAAGDAALMDALKLSSTMRSRTADAHQMAKQLSLPDVAKLLDATLQEEEKADALLSSIAETSSTKLRNLESQLSAILSPVR